ncbi:unnamed protein product [Chondrus crispus]|uniref:Uncharacterized protein n=1 Tax=Chondrus crispus TaxID=2769 RepID=R7Q5Y7_CHOCR|nr:unnamed protein product [Chondrus crispus]CDF33258.1 unnamed protein product [Chondrus crispus]|eukprot:XP_005713061.1 unnamed protein product [Chondrus crispus]
MQRNEGRQLLELPHMLRCIIQRANKALVQKVVRPEVDLNLASLYITLQVDQAHLLCVRNNNVAEPLLISVLPLERDDGVALILACDQLSHRCINIANKLMAMPRIALKKGQSQPPGGLAVMQLLLGDAHLIKDDVVIPVDTNAIPTPIHAAPHALVADLSLSLQLIKLGDPPLKDGAGLLEQGGRHAEDDGQAGGVAQELSGDGELAAQVLRGARGGSGATQVRGDEGVGGVFPLVSLLVLVLRGGGDGGDGGQALRQVGPTEAAGKGGPALRGAPGGHVEQRVLPGGRLGGRGQREDEAEVRRGEQGVEVQDGAAEEVVAGELGVAGRVAVEDIDEQAGRGRLGRVRERDGGRPHRVEVVLDRLRAADAFGRTPAPQRVAHQERVGQREKVLVGEVGRGEAQLDLALRHGCGGRGRGVGMRLGRRRAEACRLRPEPRPRTAAAGRLCILPGVGRNAPPPARTSARPREDHGGAGSPRAHARRLGAWDAAALSRARLVAVARGRGRGGRGAAQTKPPQRRGDILSPHKLGTPPKMSCNRRGGAPVTSSDWLHDASKVGHPFLVHSCM